MRNILKIIFLIFFEFFTKTVLKTLLRGREIVRKNYGIVFEKFPKIMFFLLPRARPPSTTTIHHHHHHHPPSVTLKHSRGQKRPAEYGVFEIKKLLLGPEIKQKEIKLGPHTGPPKG